MSTSNKPAPREADLFVGPGRARALCRAIDWAANPLGPAHLWPAPLRTATRLCLDSQTPTALWVGPELIMLHNDAYIPMLGPMYPSAMGRPMGEGWPEVFEMFGPLCLEIMSRGISAREVNGHYRPQRHGHHEDAYFTYSLTPLRDETGAVLGVFNVLEETTRMVQSRTLIEERQAFLLQLSDVLRSLSSTSEVQAAAARLLGEHLHAAHAYYYDYDEASGEGLVQRAYVRPGEPSVAGTSPVRWFPGIQEIARGKTLAIADTASSLLLTEKERAACPGLRLAAYIMAPLLKGGRPRGAFVVSEPEPRIWTAAEVALVEDVAERTWEAAQRARAEAALQESEGKYRALLDSIAEGFCVIEMIFDDANEPIDYRFLEVNAAFEAQSGAQGALGRRMREIAPQHEESWFQIYGRVALTGEPARFENPAAIPNRYFEVYAFRVDAPELRRVAVLFNDISERKSFEERLRESERRKDDLLAMLGHELRNPLAAIRNAAGLIELSEPGDGRLRRMHGVLERQTAHMTRLIDGLLEVSRVGRGKLALNLEHVDLCEVLQVVLRDRLPHARARDQRLDLQSPDHPVWVRVDRVRMAQVFDNLVGNAIKFTQRAGAIHVQLREAEGKAVVTIRDSGIGIRPSMLERIFEPFLQDAPQIARETGGLGLGLALSRGLLELHGGEIEARSDGPGKGAEMEVRLPLASMPAAQERVEQDLRVEPRRVLIVEDNADTGETLRELLEMLGHTVAMAETGARALDVLRERGADFVLCDLGLPGMSGYDMARAVRSDSRLRSTPLVALTGYGQPEDRRRTADAGFDAHLTKPVDIHALNAVFARFRPEQR